jgi:hypothetical protein
VSRYASLSRAELAILVPELLLIGQLMDRAGMPWCISAFGRERMLQVAIDEWAAASPIYTRRMQQALNYAPAVPGKGDVITIFKGLQLDIGAPPQFMDFRYTINDPWHGEFHLDHCGALMDVEPMGPDYVKGMCHDIEDPTFDATAVATNPKAQVRPIHRPPRVPADRAPHCHWTVIIDESYQEVVGTPELAINERSRAATVELAPIDPSDEGTSAYDGPLLDDLDFAAFSHSALVRIADEVCLQMALLDNGFALAVAKRVESPEQLVQIRRKQLIGFAGIAAYRIARALDILPTPEGALRMLDLHPVFNPDVYVRADFDGERVVVHPSPVHDDSGWAALIGPEWHAALQTAVQVLDPHFDVEVEAEGPGWSARLVRRDEPAEEASELAVTKFSTGTDFAFETRTSLPIVAVT